MNWLVERLAQALGHGEREVVLGDLAECGATGWQSAVQLTGLIARRQLVEWKNRGPWVALVGIVGGAGLSLVGLAMSVFRDAGLQSQTWWRYGVRYHTGLSANEDIAIFATLVTAISVWAWMAGFVMRKLSGPAAWVIGGLLALLWAPFGWGIALLVPIWFGMRRARFPGWPRAVALASLLMAALVWWALELRVAGFARWSLGTWRRPGPGIWDLLGVVMACWPAVYVLAMNRRRGAMKATAMAIGVLLMAGNMAAAEGVKTPLIDEKARTAAPDFALADAKGKVVKLSALKGKVVLVNFWATYCGGCKVEIPWFQEFEDTWGKKGLAVVGLSLDESGWKDVAPYVAKSGVRYPMLIADKAVLDKYTFDSMPATYLVDKEGRVAARYIGLVDRADIEGKITELIRR